MKVTDFTRQAVAVRRQKRDMEKAGYRFLPEIEWRINRGGEWGCTITEVVLGVNGNSLFYKVEKIAPEKKKGTPS